MRIFSSSIRVSDTISSRLLAFLLENMLIVGETLFSTHDFSSFLLLFLVSLTYVLLSEFNFEPFEFLLLLEESKLAVVADVVDLLLVFLDFDATLVDIPFLLSHKILQFLDFILIFLDSSLISDNFVFKVLHLVGEFAAKNLYTVDFGKIRL